MDILNIFSDRVNYKLECRFVVCQFTKSQLILTKDTIDRYNYFSFPSYDQIHFYKRQEKKLLLST
jgi:hypothetical protein